MPEVTHYEHGVPSWVDIGTPDPTAALAFYSGLFDWEGQDMGEEAGHYTIVSKGGRQVAAISPAQDSGPPRWTTYINVDDVDTVATRAQAAGGTVVVAPMDVMTAGRMAIFADTTGAVVAAWQPGDHIGAQLVNEPGAMTWSELATSDLAKSKDFYSEVFGWGWGGCDEYAEAQVSGRTIGGVMPRPPTMPAEYLITGWSTSGRQTSTPKPSRPRREVPPSWSNPPTSQGRADSRFSSTPREPRSPSSRANHPGVVWRRDSDGEVGG